MKFIDEINIKYPPNYLEGRGIIEGNLIGCVYKNPDLLNDINIKDFKTINGQFYIRIAKEMSMLGYKFLDIASISVYLSNKDKLKEAFDDRNNYNPIKELTSIVNINNFETYVEQLTKSNILLDLYDKGFDLLKLPKEADKISKMNSSELYDYLDYQVNSTFLRKGTNIKIENLLIDDVFLEACNKGEEMGASYSSTCPMMSYLTSGLHLNNVGILAGTSGVGKSSFIFANLIVPLLEKNFKVCIAANEQNIKDWKKLILGTVVSNKIGYYDSPRKRIQIGNFSEKDWNAYKQSQEWINKYEGNLKFVKIYDYDVNKIIKIIKQLSKEGFSYFFYDTFKSFENAGNNGKTVHGELVEDSKKLLQIADKENVGIILTQQLAIHMIDTRYLTANCLSNSKQVKEVVSELFLLRNLWDDEYTNEKYDVKPFKYIKDENGKYGKSKEMLTLDPEKKYMIVFLDKTRSDESGVCLLFQWQSHFNKWTELGYCKPHKTTSYQK